MLWRFAQIDIETRGMLRCLSETHACTKDTQNRQKANETGMNSPYQDNSFKSAKAYHTCEPIVATAADLAGAGFRGNRAAFGPSATISV